MIYLTQNKTPKELLELCGFMEAPDRGMQIVIRQGKSKHPPTPYDVRTLVPQSRFHALYFENQISLHIDSGRLHKKHRSFGHNKQIVEMIEKIKSFDI